MFVMTVFLCMSRRNAVKTEQRHGKSGMTGTGQLHVSRTGSGNGLERRLPIQVDHDPLSVLYVYIYVIYQHSDIIYSLIIDTHTVSHHIQQSLT